MLYGALEAGGTKMVCAIGDENGKILEQISIPTVSPEETMPKIIDWFKDKNIEALGIAAFGPIDLNRKSPTYGSFTTTPKLKWANYNIVKDMRDALHIPIGFDTDVNGSLLGEITYGQAKGLTDAVYLTIGTGVGGGVMSNGKLVHGMLHPELGHMKLLPYEGDTYKGHCPYHGTCLEGMASGPAIEDRWGKKAIDLKDDAKVWDMEAFYIAQALCNIILITSPQIIILGGGVMHQLQLFPLIREKVREMLNGYLKTSELSDLDHYIVPASLNDDQGIMGCIKLAIDEKELEG
ncbi:ROK family protein [Oribacterium sp. NK2B42]|uniref:ROK family protein n=1 Tax=Oribacterium sp. NK2B42 TaxID=689781 RepID=UPI000428EC8B|nr:ROK family protein [Oribacterium sp. NK2B42]